MSRHDYRVRLMHMRDLAASTLDAVRGKSLSDFPAGELTTDGLIRRLEVIGEAASQVPSEKRRLHPTIPWQDVIDFRNRLIHGYDTVNLEIVWRIIQEELPPLLEALKAILAKESPGK